MSGITQSAEEVNDVRNAGLKAFIKDLHERVHNLAVFDGAAEVNAHCDELETQVTLAVESAVTHLHLLRRNLLAEIADYRTGLVDATSLAKFSYKSTRSRQNVSRLAKEVNLFNKVWSVSQVSCLATDEEIEMTYEKARAYDLEAKRLESKLRKQVFNGRFMRFKRNSLFSLTSGLIGHLEFAAAKPKLPSKIVLKCSVVQKSSELGFLLLLPNNDVACLASSIKIWDHKTAGLVYELADTDTISSMTLLPSGDLASGSASGTVRIWNLASRSVVRTLDNHETPVRALQALENGSLASCSLDGVVNIWSSHSDAPLATLPGSGFFQRVLLGLLSNGHFIAYNGSSVEVRSSKDGRLVQQMPASFGPMSGLVVLPNDDLGLWKPGAPLSVFNLEERSLIGKLGASDLDVSTWNLLPSSGYLLAAGHSGFYFWDPGTLTLVHKVPILLGDSPIALAVSQDGQLVVTASSGHEIRVWTLST